MILVLHILILSAKFGELLCELRDVEDDVRLAILGGLGGVNLLLGAHGSGVLGDRFI